MRFVRCLLPLLACTVHALAQKTPEELSRLVLDHFENGTQGLFDAAVPVPEARTVVRMAREGKLGLHPGLARVVTRSGESAVLLLSGNFTGLGNSGDETLLAAPFSGLYEARLSSGAWRITGALPIERTGRILRQGIDVTIEPGEKLDVATRLTVTGVAATGLVLRLNHAARLTSVSWNGRTVDHAFEGGVLWIRAGGDGELNLTYQLKVEHGPHQTNSACFLPQAGHVRDQYLWHPFFGVTGENDQADLTVSVRIPAPFRVATGLPQSERIEGEDRLVEGRSTFPTSGLSLFYDREWQVLRESIGGAKLEIFVTADFQPTPAKMIEEFQWTHGFLAKRFGAPQSGYTALIQARARGDNGWRHLTNQGLVAGKNGGEFYRSGLLPGANFAHEIAHAWTRGAGSGAHFIQEGWATYCESLILRERLGRGVESAFWDGHARLYLAAHDGKARLDDDPLNGGVSYSKGAWIFRMLEHRLGTEKFQALMSKFAGQSQRRPASLTEFIDQFGLRAFLQPWLSGAHAPALQTRVAGSTVTIIQSGELFDLDVVVRTRKASGEPIDRRVHVVQRETLVDFGQPVDNIEIDPDRVLLLRR